MILLGDCLERLKELEENSVDAVITDPPWAIKFMSKRWDYQIPSTDIWKEVLRVLKPGGHALVCCGTRTQHRMVVNVEDAGFEIKDVVVHLYGSGFPKSLNIQKSARSSGIGCECETPAEFEMSSMSGADVQTPISIEETAGSVLQSSMSEQGLSGSMLRAQSEKGLTFVEESGVEGRSDLQEKQGQLHRTEVCPVSKGISRDGSKGRLRNGAPSDNGETYGPSVKSHRSSPSQRPQYKKQPHFESRTIPKQSSTQTCGSCGKAVIPQGLGTALKPAAEFWTLARKPLSESTVAENFLKWGVGGLNIDESRIESEANRPTGLKSDGTRSQSKAVYGDFKPETIIGESSTSQGRWPANLLLDETAAEMLDEQSLAGGMHSAGSAKKSGQFEKTGKNSSMFGIGDHGFNGARIGDSGGASRFFYVAKASKRERNAGLDGMPEREKKTLNDYINPSEGRTASKSGAPAQNFHPTVKPIKLMEYLCKLITPPGGVILDPFCGSGSTGVAAFKNGFKFIGIEMNKEYVAIAEKRIAHAKEGA